MTTVGRRIAALIVAPFLVLVAGIGGCEVRKAYYDWQVRKMCEADGGVKVFDRIVLSPDAARQLPRVGSYFGVSPERLANATDPAYSKVNRIPILEGDLSIIKYEEEIVRKADGRVVGRVVTYTRSGGDFPSFAHPSSFSCPVSADKYAGIHSIYQLGDTSK